MNPAFSAAQLRDFLPLFHKRAAKARVHPFCFEQGTERKL